MIIFKIIAIAGFIVMTGIIVFAGIMGYSEEHRLSRALHTKAKSALKTK